MCYNINMNKFEWGALENNSLKWIGVDWDNCLVDNTGYPDFIPKEPLPGAVEALKRLNNEGYKIVIYTARHWADYLNIERYCEYYGIPARRIICGKPLFNCIIDDKNIEFSGDWSEVVDKVAKRNHP